VGRGGKEAGRGGRAALVLTAESFCKCVKRETTRERKESLVNSNFPLDPTR